MKNKRIAIYTGELPPPTFIDRLIVGLADAGHTILLFGSIQKKISYQHQNIQVIGYSGRWSKFLQLIKYSVLLFFLKNSKKKRLDNLLKVQNRSTYFDKMKYYPILYYQPDIFHLQWAKGIADWVWVKEFDMKLFVSLRGAHINYTPVSEPKYAEIYKKYFPLVDGFHAVSNAIAEEALKYNVSKEKTRVVYSGLNLNKIEFRISKKQENEIQIISVGRSHWKKGYNYALDAMRILKEENIKFKYTIVGIDLNEELYFQKTQLGLEDDILFIEKLSFEEVVDKIRKSAILLLPSVEEGIANVVLEAMALGTLVISTNCGGMAEVIEDNSNGYLVPTRDSEAIAKAVKAALKLNDAQRETMIVKAREYIEENHSEQKMINEMQNLYDKL
ncbi:MAG TPA: glycosyltransferase family 4 protein [Flavobacterium sp.]|nr:glycosyltransferase family 4 protein [Flavobacterium sp.]